ncbi:purine-nucleoside phosphorylase [Glutamicibacter sp. M10]|uniref:phosphorylase family protein n=1 Tax=Glutamicibacter sp. M10 TaxID=3023076 RepID=UPI0021C5B8E9|nr:purine-nucleoside phosphorylase [Glutamicibacter sp. M10]UXN31579.1 purine-nucleoside phosphorylase [Glutamicibacter sp. M10]
MSDQKSLLVFAHQDEAVAFADVEHLISGVGKVNASVALAGALADGNIKNVIVLGTAGVVGHAGEDRPSLETIYQVTKLIQHDFPLPSADVDPTGEILLPDFQAVMATGDVFVSNDEQRVHIKELGASLVDMEGYAYASICQRFDIPLQIFKIPSDYADDSASIDEWDEIAKQKSVALREFYDKNLV